MVTERNDRKNFIKKVYAILSCQLLFTVIITCIPFASEGVRDWMQENFWLGYVCWFLTIILLIVIFCFKNVAKTYPKNMILLGLFTVLEAYIVAFICTFYEPFSVFMAAVSTCAITIGLTVYAWTTRRDFTTMGGCVIGFAIAAIFFAIIIGTNPGAYVSAILILIIILIYCFFIVYDTQLIAGGRYA
jgi:FtsH-binding integral membrane protein